MFSILLFNNNIECYSCISMNIVYGFLLCVFIEKEKQKNDDAELVCWLEIFNCFFNLFIYIAY